MASSVIKQPNPYRYRDATEKTTYKVKTVNLYGMALVMTQYNLWAVHYDNNGTYVVNITNLPNQHTLTATYDGTELTLTDNATLWGGITVYQ